MDSGYKQVVELLENSIPVIRSMGIKIVEFGPGHARIVLPLAPNINHIGTAYAGSMFTLAEFSGGVIFAASFDYMKFFPIVKEVSIRYLKPAATDLSLDVSMDAPDMERLMDEAVRRGKADWEMDLEPVDASGLTCCRVHGVWQMRPVRKDAAG